jgi:IMP cyclohydrolase
MPNPNGPYPGRQLFVGLTLKGAPAIIYLVTGRSPASRERRAIVKNNTAIIGPLGDVPYDPLRHYTAIKFDNVSGIVAVSNGIQTEAIYETYRLLYNVGAEPSPLFLKKLMDGAGSEPDSLNTPRIGGVITKGAGLIYTMVAIKRHDKPARVFSVKPTAGTFIGISTYQGDMDNPRGYDPGTGVKTIRPRAVTAAALAQYLYDLSNATYNGEDIRVCSIGGVCVNGKFTLSVVNKFSE